MGMTMVEKILARGAGLSRVRPGELITTQVDLILGNDITAPVAIREFERIGVEKVFDPDRIALVPDHFVPNKDIKSAEQAKTMREFARRQGITHYFEVGQMGIEHALLPEKGLVLPGEIIIGADSHTCTYGALGAFATGVGSTDMAAAMAWGRTWFKVPETMRFVYHGRRRDWVSGKDLILHTIGDIGVDGALYTSMEFSGEAIRELPMDDRLSMCNMAIEAGGKCGLIAPDETTFQYLEGRAKKPYEVFLPDEDATYTRVIEYDVGQIEPQVAFPHLPSNTRPVSQVGEVPVDQAVIGSCTNGRISDLRVAAKVLAGKTVHPRTRLIVIPATQEIYLQALREGLLETFINAGGAVSTPTCGPCLGGYMGVLASGERAIATTNRNFRGRMGHPDSEVYLAGPAVVAASAVAGKIVPPEEVAAR